MHLSRHIYHLSYADNPVRHYVAASVLLSVEKVGRLEVFMAWFCFAPNVGAAPPPVLPALPRATGGDDGEGARLGVTAVLVQPTPPKLLHPQPQPRPQRGVQHADTVHLKVVVVQSCSNYGMCINLRRTKSCDSGCLNCTCSLLAHTTEYENLLRRYWAASRDMPW